MLSGRGFELWAWKAWTTWRGCGCSCCGHGSGVSSVVPVVTRVEMAGVDMSLAGMMTRDMSGVRVSSDSVGGRNVVD